MRLHRRLLGIQLKPAQHNARRIANAPPLKLVEAPVMQAPRARMIFQNLPRLMIYLSR